MNITVIGIGKLGLGLALLFANNGYNVTGVDINSEYVNNLANKTITFIEPEYDELLKNTKNFKVTTSLKDGLDFADLIFIVVQTPNSGGERFYDHTILSNLLFKINTYKPKNKNIIIGCTVMPKYIDEVANSLINECENCNISYNPEFVAQGEVIKGFKNADIILVGTNNNNLRPILEEIYTKIAVNKPKFCFMKPLEAEIVKISLNGFITTKISYANMISDLCDTVGADKKTVLDAIGSDSRIGNKYFKPGYSFGGPCFPRDTRALKLLMDKYNIDSDLLKATTLYNEKHIDFQVKELLKLNKDEYTIENVCYKENTRVPLIEESAKLKIAKKLVENGKKVVISDYSDTINEVKKEFGNLFQFEIKDINYNNTNINQNNYIFDDIKNVYNFWNDRPCNIKHSDKDIGTKEYFEEVTARKYKVEPHILEFANFSKYTGKQVLEVGCGIGTAAQSFIENGAIYTGLDLTENAINLTKKRLEVFGLKGNIIQGNIEEIDNIDNNQYDLVYSFGVLHHTPNTEKAIKNIWKLLKPGGEFKLMMYAKNSIKYFEIKDGLDQYEAQSGVPIAKTYTNEDIYKLLKDFSNIEIQQQHIFPYKVDEYKKYNYVKKEYFEHMPEQLFKCLERNLGWHLCIKCFKL
jgi:nucleotide sugar dehydrogenase